VGSPQWPQGCHDIPVDQEAYNTKTKENQYLSLTACPLMVIDDGSSGQR